MLADTTRLCEAKLGMLYLWEGDAFRAVAFHDAAAAFVETQAHSFASWTEYSYCAHSSDEKGHSLANLGGPIVS
jgi:hypothetical protein